MAKQLGIVYTDSPTEAGSEIFSVGSIDARPDEVSVFLLSV